MAASLSSTALLSNLKHLSKEKEKERLTTGRHGQFSLAVLGKAARSFREIDDDDEENDSGSELYSRQSSMSSDTSVCGAAGAEGEVADIYQEDSAEYKNKQDNPLYILKVAAEGDLEELTRIVNIDPAKLLAQDHRGQNIVHHAAMWSRIEILDYLYEFVDIRFVDLNDQDKLGNTSMHFAVERNEMVVLDWLLDHGADMRIKNILNQAPIHVAVELGLIEMVERIIEEDPDIVHFPGDLGFTPLLYACKHDRPDVARVLLMKGADMMQDCDIGYSAIHAATKNGCSKIVDVLIEFAEKRGISGKDLIHTMDSEKNLPLHAAVNSGDVRAVLVCLKAGADISAPHREDKQTAIHYAASKGALDLIKAMFDAQPEKVENCVAQRDVLDQTPLHKASMYNHLDVVKYLLECGSGLNTQDEDRRTPLIAAAMKNAVQVVNFLLSKRANISLRDKDNRSFLHMAIITGVKLKDLEIKSLKTLKVLLNERDDFGCCPAHYASKAGQLATLKGLMGLGAQMTIKDNDKQNPLHVGCRYGRIHTVKSLLASENGKMLMTEIDIDGHNALHIAAIYGQGKIIALLLGRGAQLTKDFALNSVLHLTAECGSYTAVLQVLELAPHYLNHQNRAGNTALHLAAQNGHALVVDHLLTVQAKILTNADGASFLDLAVMRYHKDIAAAVIRHERCNEVMRSASTFGLPFIGLIQHLPEMGLLYLDKCMCYSNETRKSEKFYMQYNFRSLTTPEKLMGKNFEKAGQALPLWPLNMMVRYHRVDCLAHPLCVTFLDQKWKSYGSLVYNFRISTFLVSVFILTSIVFDVDDSAVAYLQRRQLAENAGQPVEPFSIDLSQGGLLIRMVIMAILGLYNVGFHALNIAQQKFAFFVDGQNYIDLTFYVTILIVTLPSLFGYPDLSTQYVAGVISLFCGWLNFLLQMQRFNYFGLYIVMFQEILKTVIRALIVFSFIIFAFSISMTLCFRRNNGRHLDYSSPFMTIITILPMMMGDINYTDYMVPSFDSDWMNRSLVPELTAMLFACFVIIMAILLKNILIGLAVGNIESVQKNARLKRLATQVIYFTDLESRLPRSFLRSRQVFDYRFYPNRKGKSASWLKALTGGEGGSAEGAIAEGFGGDDDDDDETEYLQQQLSAQGRSLTNLVSRYEMHRELMKVIHQEFDTEICRGGKRAERELESGDEDDDKGDDKAVEDSGTAYHSAASKALWHQINKRFANQNKTKTNIWIEDDGHADEEDQQQKASNEATEASNSHQQKPAVKKLL